MTPLMMKMISATAARAIAPLRGRCIADIHKSAQHQMACRLFICGGERRRLASAAQPLGVMEWHEND